MLPGGILRLFARAVGDSMRNKLKLRRGIWAFSNRPRPRNFLASAGSGATITSFGAKTGSGTASRLWGSKKVLSIHLARQLGQLGLWRLGADSRATISKIPPPRPLGYFLTAPAQATSWPQQSLAQPQDLPEQR